MGSLMLKTEKFAAAHSDIFLIYILESLLSFHLHLLHSVTFQNLKALPACS